jgi:hypothetical protein
MSASTSHPLNVGKDLMIGGIFDQNVGAVGDNIHGAVFRERRAVECLIFVAVALTQVDRWPSAEQCCMYFVRITCLQYLIGASQESEAGIKLGKCGTTCHVIILRGLDKNIRIYISYVAAVSRFGPYHV